MRDYRVFRIAAVAALTYCIIWITEFPCPFKLITSCPCPACGAAHALNDLVHGRFARSFIRNPLAIPLVCVFFYAIYCELFSGTCKIQKQREKILLTAVFIIFIIYLLRTFFNCF